ncbi:MAG TPA: endonuclease [Candidatus Magasanikbacteria bacterium]|nr:endonuclease [Candidatus Magasanikbacteria bacterium]
MHKVYILKSLKQTRYYIGHCEDLDVRLERHNKGCVKSTKPYRPWQIIYTEDLNSKSEAFKREMQIKSYKGGEAFKKLINKS